MLYFSCMRKLLFPIGLAVVVVSAAIGVRALGTSDVTVVLRDVPSAAIAAGQPDALGLDVTITPRRADRLDALFVKQEGTARWQTDLTDAKLWADAGAEGLQGIGIDRLLALGVWNANENGWAFSGMDEPVPAGGARLFVTVSTYRSPTGNATIQLAIPAFVDLFTPMSYDTGDRGVFLRTAAPVPTVQLTNAARQSVVAFGADSRAPLVRITEPKAGESFGKNWLLVRGIAQDSGGSAVARVQVGLSRPGRDITWVEATPESAGYATWEARFFELAVPQQYELRVKGEDWVGNRSAESASVTVTLTE